MAARAVALPSTVKLSIMASCSSAVGTSSLTVDASPVLPFGPRRPCGRARTRGPTGRSRRPRALRRVVDARRRPRAATAASSWLAAARAACSASSVDRDARVDRPAAVGDEADDGEEHDDQADDEDRRGAAVVGRLCSWVSHRRSLPSCGTGRGAPSSWRVTSVVPGSPSIARSGPRDGALDVDPDDLPRRRTFRSRSAGAHVSDDGRRGRRPTSRAAACALAAVALERRRPDGVAGDRLRRPPAPTRSRPTATMSMSMSSRMGTRTTTSTAIDPRSSSDVCLTLRCSSCPASLVRAERLDRALDASRTRAARTRRRSRSTRPVDGHTDRVGVRLGDLDVDVVCNDWPPIASPNSGPARCAVGDRIAGSRRRCGRRAPSRGRPPRRPRCRARSARTGRSRR